MKKVSFLFTFLVMLVLTGCQFSSPERSSITEEVQYEGSSGSLFGTSGSTISYQHRMEKPDFAEMINGEEIQLPDYTKPRKRTYKLTQEDVDLLKECEGRASLNSYNGGTSIALTDKDLKVGKSFVLTGNYDGHNNHPLTGAILHQLQKHGVGIMPFQLGDYPSPYYAEEF